MALTYSTQRFIWENGIWIGLEPVTQVTSETHHAAAEEVMGEQMVLAGPINRITLKVWEKGKARQSGDVQLYWRLAP